MSQVNATHFIGVNDPIQDEAAVSEIAFDDPIDVNENDFIPHAEFEAFVSNKSTTNHGQLIFINFFELISLICKFAMFNIVINRGCYCFLRNYSLSPRLG